MRSFHARGAARAAAALAAAALLVLVAACGEAPTASPPVPTPPAPPAPVEPAIRITAGAGVTDTVDAQLAQGLLVEVRGRDGAPAPGVVVRFEAGSVADTARRTEAGVRVCGLTVPVCGADDPNKPGAQVTAEITDARGIARAAVRLGTVPGPAMVRIVVPEFGLRDSAAYVVQPGAPVRIGLNVNDDRGIVGRTTLAVGGTMALAARILDRYNNLRADPQAFTISGTGPHATSVEVDPTTGRVQARDVGMPWVIVRSGPVADSVQLRVVPAGRLLVSGVSGFDLSNRLMNTDGSARKDIPKNYASYTSSPARLDPGQFLVLARHPSISSYGGVPGTILVVDTLGAVQQSISAPEFGMIDATRRLADGTIVAVSRRDPTFGQSVSGTFVLRISPAGTVTVVRTLPNYTTSYLGVDISPDGTRVAYPAAVSPNASRLTVMDLGTGTATPIESLPTSAVRWSPSGSRLAYLADRPVHDPVFGLRTLVLVNADGSGRRELGADGFLNSWVAWSPDERFIAAYTLSGAADYLRLSDGLEVAVRYPFTFSQYQSENLTVYDWR